MRTRLRRLGHRIRDSDAQATWGASLLLVALALVMAALVVGFWRAGGSVWLHSTVSRITTF